MEQAKINRKLKDDPIHLRAMTIDDREFLLSVYEASREIELAMVPWDAGQKRDFVEMQFNAQLRHYENAYKDTTHEIIMADDESVGRLLLSRGNDKQIAILDITVMSKYRKRGIATRLIRDLQDEAANLGKSLRIFIEQFSPSQNLFRKLGFEVVDDPGVNLRFEWRSKVTTEKI